MQLRNMASTQHPSAGEFKESGSYPTPEVLIQGSSPGIGIAVRWLDAALFFCLAVFAICAPLATKGAVTAFRAALLVWLTKLLLDRGKLSRQPLALPLLLFLLLTGISTLFSTEPLLSWGRMRGITELTIAILVGQSLKSLRQIKILVGLLLLGCLSSVAITAWQYTVGLGVKLIANDPASVSLSQFGLRAGDIIQKIDHTTVHAPRELFRRLDALASKSSVELTVARPAELENPAWNGNPLVRLTLRIERKDKLEETLRQPGFVLSRGHPLRAEGTLKHYFPYSEVMVLIGLVPEGRAT
jgi:hypothetical protein